MNSAVTTASAYQLWLKDRCIWAEEQFDGRLNRLGFLWRIVLIFAIGFATTYIADVLHQSGQVFFSWIVYFVPMIPLIIIEASFIARRLHDMNRTAMHFWLLVIPFYNIYIALLLFFKKGTNGTNQYGPDPISAISPDT